MLLKSQNLESVLLKNKPSPVYLLAGVDPYLSNQAYRQIEAAFKKEGPFEKVNQEIGNMDDWQNLILQLNSQSLFCDRQLVIGHISNAKFDKKIIECLQDYLSDINQNSLLILKAPNFTYKQLKPLANMPLMTIIWVQPYTEKEQKAWIENALNDSNFKFAPDITQLILSHTLGNMDACAQCIDKLKLIYQPGESLEEAQLLSCLFDACQYSIYELVDAILLGDIAKSIHLIRKIRFDKGEITLVLWTICQQVRLLISLHGDENRLANKPVDWATYQIWSSKKNLYLSALKHYSILQLNELLSLCHEVDKDIKTNNHLIDPWQSIEFIILKFNQQETINH